MQARERVSILTADYASVLAILLACWVVTMPGGTRAEPPRQLDDKTEFLRLCDLACEELNKDITPFEEKYRTVIEAKTHHVPFFEDSYAVRALAVAYDMTGKEQYLGTCKRWADRVVAFQDKMVPKGAYFLNYAFGRQPGRTSGGWWVADSGSVAMGIMATAVRTTDKAEKQRYLDSVKAFARLVTDNYVRDGGITDGIWSEYDGPWWCSTSTFGAAMFVLYDETGEERYGKVARGTLDWMIRHDFRETEPKSLGFQENAPHVVFYSFEFYAASLKHLEAGSPTQQAALAQIAEALKWMAENQKGRGATSQWNDFKGATYMAGMPYLMYVFARELPEHQGLVQAADQELQYVHDLLWKNGDPPLSLVEPWENMTWMMMSYAEKFSPGSLFRKSQP